MSAAAILLAADLRPQMADLVAEIRFAAALAALVAVSAALGAAAIMAAGAPIEFVAPVVLVAAALDPVAAAAVEPIVCVTLALPLGAAGDPSRSTHDPNSFVGYARSNSRPPEIPHSGRWRQSVLTTKRRAGLRMRAFSPSRTAGS